MPTDVPASTPSEEPSAEELLSQQTRRLELKSRRLVSTRLAGLYRSAFRGSGLELDHVRHYVPGDDVRALDWNVWARTGELHVKVMREERELNVMVLLDRSASMNFGEGESNKARVALELTALLGFSALQNQDRFGCLSLTDGLEHVHPPLRGRAHLLQLLRHLLSDPPAESATDLCAGLGYVQRHLRKGAVLFILSDFLVSGYEDQLRKLALKHRIILLRLYHPSEQLPQGMGFLPVVDAENGTRGIRFTGMRRFWKAAAAAPKPAGLPFPAVGRHLRSLQRQTGLGLIELDTTRDPVAPLQHFFAARR